MKYLNLFLFSEEMRRFAFGCFLAVILALPSGTVSAIESQAASPVRSQRPFNPGEKLTYTISWSNMISAGTAVMEVKKKEADGRPRSSGSSQRPVRSAWWKFYPVSDRVQSFIDRPDHAEPVFSLDQSHGKRKKSGKWRSTRTAGTSRLCGRQTGDHCDPEDVQDALSSLYYRRTRKDFVVGKADRLQRARRRQELVG